MLMHTDSKSHTAGERKPQAWERNIWRVSARVMLTSVLGECNYWKANGDEGSSTKVMGGHKVEKSWQNKSVLG